MLPVSKTILVSKSARYYVLGEASENIKSIWFVLHGFAQLANDFIKNFSHLAENNNLVVAPEAFNKFYLRGSEGKVGATWMTKENRENEITDYINYLNTVYDELMVNRNEPKIKINVLGFSQGAATAVRWAVNGKSKIDRLILWSGPLPHDIEFKSSRDLLNSMGLTIIAGDNDEYLTKKIIEKETAKLNENNIIHTVHIFSGKHEINSELVEKYFD